VLKVLSPTELTDEARRVLSEGIRAKTQGGLEVETVRVDELPRTVSGKHRLLLQHLDISRYFGATGAAGGLPH